MVYGRPPPLQIPCMSKDGPVEAVDITLLAATPIKLLERKMVKQGNKAAVFGLIQ